MVASIQIHSRHDATYRRPVRLRAAVERTEPNQVMGKLSATSATRGLTAGPAASPWVSSGGPPASPEEDCSGDPEDPFLRRKPHGLVVVVEDGRD